MTTRRPACPKIPFSMISLTASRASSGPLQIMTPLPAARPSAFTTMGRSS